MIKEDFLKNYTKLISSGSTPKGGNKVYLKEGEILFFRGQNILMNKFSDHDSVYISNEIHNRMKRTWVKKGDVLLVITGSIGRTAFYEGEDHKANVNQHVCIIRLKDFNVLNPHYLSYFLVSPTMQRHIKRISIGATRPALNFSQIGKFKIPIPPMKFQKKIVKILEKTEKLKELRVEADELAEKYLKSVFLEMFGDPISNPKNWPKDNLENLSSKITDGTHKTPKYQENGVKFISAKNIKRNEINWTDIKYIMEQEHKKLIKRCNPEFGDIVLTKSGSIGESALINVNFDFSLFESLALIKYERKKINGYFLKYLLDTDSIKHRYKKSTKGVAVKHLHLVDIRKLPIILPPIELQNKFADIVQQVETIKSDQSQSKQQIDNLFNTLMQKAFKGELVC